LQIAEAKARQNSPEKGDASYRMIIRPDNRNDAIF
jgi:hypothetical protein